MFHHSFIKVLFALFVLTQCFQAVQSSNQQIDSELIALVKEKSLKGLQIQITKKQKTIYYQNLGIKNERNESIDKNTMFRVASLSKSLVSVAIMQLVDEKKLQLTDSVSSILGYKFENPFFPQIPITVQMILTHQSGLLECDPYYTNFLLDTYNAKSGHEVPQLKQILTEGGKYYNKCLFESKSKPGQYFRYVNLNFGIAGTIVQKISGTRFDIYQNTNILNHLSVGLAENATYNPATISNYKNLGTIFKGKDGKWIASLDDYNATIPQRNLTGYKIGSNGVIYGPQGGMRASVHHLNNYMIMLSNKGVTKEGKRLLSQQSVFQMVKPRYQYRGSGHGGVNDFNLYGLGLYTTTYYFNDKVIEHEVLRGHLGVAYGLISAYFFWKDYTFSYIVNGALYGYKYKAGTIYQEQRLRIHKIVQNFIEKQQQIIQFEEEELKVEKIQ